MDKCEEKEGEGKKVSFTDAAPIFAISALVSMSLIKATSDNTSFQELVKEFVIGDNFDEDFSAAKTC